MHAEQLHWSTISLLGRSWRSIEITTNRHHVRATGRKRWCHWSRLAYKAIHEDLESTRFWRAQAHLNIYGINDHSMRSFRDRYEVIYGWPSPTAMIPRAEATFHAERSRPLRPCQLCADDFQSNVQSSNHEYWSAGPAKLFARHWESSSACALGSIVSITGYWDAYKLDIPMTWHMAMAMALAIVMVMVTSKRKPPSIPPCQVKAHVMIADLTEITVSHSDNDLHLLQAMGARFDDRMPDIQEVEILRTVLLWMFLLSLLSSLLLPSLDFGLVKMASPRVFATSGDKSSAGGVFLGPESAE